MRRLIIFAIACLFSQSIYAQQGLKDLNYPDRFIISEALLFLDDYEDDVIWEGIGDTGTFYDYFGKTANIINDIPMANSQEMVSFNKYRDDLFKFNSSYASIKLQPYSVELNESFSSNENTGSGDVFIDVMKYISFYSSNNVRVNYKDTLDQKFHLKYTYNEFGVDFYIQRISSNVKVGKYIVVKFQNKGMTEDQFQQEFGTVIVESKLGRQQLDETYGIFTLNDFSEEIDFSIYSENILFFQKKSISKFFKSPPAGDSIGNPSNIAEINFRKKSWSISPEFSFEWRNRLSQSSLFQSDVDSRVSQLCYGLKVGKRLYSTKKHALALQLGGGLSSLTSQFEITPFTSTSAQIDDVGDPYTRIVRTKRLLETGTISRNYISVGLLFVKRLNLTELGLYSNVNYLLKSNYQYSSDATAEYSGLYGPEYFNIQINDPMHYFFGEHNVYLEDNATIRDEINLTYGLSVSQDLNRRTQLSFSFGYNTVLNSPFGIEDNLSTLLYEFQSIQELDPDLWNDRFSTKISMIYFL